MNPPPSVPERLGTPGTLILFCNGNGVTSKVSNEDGFFGVLFVMHQLQVRPELELNELDLNTLVIEVIQYFSGVQIIY